MSVVQLEDEQKIQSSHGECPKCHRKLRITLLHNEGGICKKCSNDKIRQPCPKCKKLFLPQTLNRYEGKCRSCAMLDSIECSECHEMSYSCDITNGKCHQCTTHSIMCPHCHRSHLRQKYELEGCPYEKVRCSSCLQLKLKNLLSQGKCIDCIRYVTCPRCSLQHPRQEYESNGCPFSRLLENFSGNIQEYLFPYDPEISPIKETPEIRSVKFERLKNIEECGICLSKYEDNDDLYVFSKCHHVFHTGCCKPWIREHKSCPTCREKI